MNVPSDLISDLFGPTEGARFVWTGEEDCRCATAADMLLGLRWEGRRKQR